MKQLILVIIIVLCILGYIINCLYIISKHPECMFSRDTVLCGMMIEKMENK